MSRKFYKAFAAAIPPNADDGLYPRSVEEHGNKHGLVSGRTVADVDAAY